MLLGDVGGHLFLGWEGAHSLLAVVGDRRTSQGGRGSTFFSGR